VAHGPSCPDFWQDKELQFFVQDGAKLISVYTLPMRIYQSIQGCVDAGTGMDTLYEQATLAVQVLKSKTHGYADLMINATISMGSSDLKVQTMEPGTEHQLMQYDGKKYVASKS
jgi:hypothetical protein